MFFEFVPAICAALLWAVSAQAVNAGLRRIRIGRVNKFTHTVFALIAALFSGFIVIWSLSGWQNPVSTISINVFMAGLFTFPIGTGLYYLCSLALGSKAEMASQFANVKPAISISIGIVLFNEYLGLREMLVSLAIFIGIAIVIIGAARKAYTKLAVILGILLAVSWSIGEAFVYNETGGASSMNITLGALTSSLFVVLLIGLGCIIFNRKHTLMSASQIVNLWPFAVHGILSFGLAYGLFFHSIRTIGLSNTVMITVCWPLLSAIIGYLLASIQGRPFIINRSMFVAMMIFSIASFGFVVSGL